MRLAGCVTRAAFFKGPVFDLHICLSIGDPFLLTPVGATLDIARTGAAGSLKATRHDICAIAVGECTVSAFRLHSPHIWCFDASRSLFVCSCCTLCCRGFEISVAPDHGMLVSRGTQFDS